VRVVQGLRVMRDVAVVSFAQSKSVRAEDTANEVEILMPVVAEAVERSGVDRKSIGFTMSGSCDYLAGVPFAFVQGLDAVGAWPPTSGGGGGGGRRGGDRAGGACGRPGGPGGTAHRRGPRGRGGRDPAPAASARRGGGRAGVAGVDVAEPHAPFSPQEAIPRD